MCLYDPLSFHLSCNDLNMFFARLRSYTLICSYAYLVYTVDLQWRVYVMHKYMTRMCPCTHSIQKPTRHLFVPLTNKIQFHLEAEFLMKYYMGVWKTEIEWIYWNNLMGYMTTFLLGKLLYTILNE